MARKENLPQGMDRLPSGSLRVRVRVAGYDPIVKTFPLFSVSVEERRRQLADAKAWAEETRRQLLGGRYVSVREAENMTLGEALERYERDGLKGKDYNAGKDRTRIKQILADPIAQRPLATLRKADIANYRDELIQRGWAKNIETAIARLGDDPSHSGRIADLRSLELLARQAREARNAERRSIESKIATIEASECIKRPARTTITNRLQLITRALKFVGQTIDGVPDLRGVPMPSASPGRERRLSPAELDSLLREGAKIDRQLPLIIRFAIETALRRERILTVRTSDIRDIGAGKQAIVFPRETAVRNKRTGIIPVTREIRAILDEALGLGSTNVVSIRFEDAAIFGVPVNKFDTWWRRLVTASSIENLHFHDLRHEATSRLFERGLTTAEVMSITGHSTTDMVDRYSHYSAALVHDKLERGLDPVAILDEIVFLTNQYKALSGDMRKLQVLFDSKN